MFVLTAIIIVVSIIKHAKTQKIVNDAIKTTIDKSKYENMNDTLPPLGKQFENDIVDDEKKVYKIKCPYCGSKYTSDKNKCPSCGAKNDE